VCSSALTEQAERIKITRHHNYRSQSPVSS
jgi:hypothetical protein